MNYKEEGIFSSSPKPGMILETWLEPADSTIATFEARSPEI